MQERSGAGGIVQAELARDLVHPDPLEAAQSEGLPFQRLQSLAHEIQQLPLGLLLLQRPVDGRLGMDEAVDLGLLVTEQAHRTQIRQAPVARDGEQPRREARVALKPGKRPKGVELGLLGQIQGAVWMGLGQALSEEVTFTNGLPVHPNILDYRVPTIEESPPIEVHIVETIDPNGPFGAKEASEGPIGSIAPARLVRSWSITRRLCET